jgi:probable rRNA maturation factor
MIVQFVNRHSKARMEPWKTLVHEMLLAAIQVLKNHPCDGKPYWTEIKPAEPAITVLFAGPIVMRRINRETRGIDRLTDVLSFPLLDIKEGELVRPLAAEDFEIDRKGRATVPLGDILIAPDVAEQQAKHYGHTARQEIAFLFIHGFLHLLGFDHENEDQKKRMIDIQKAIIREAGLNINPEIIKERHQ